MKKGIERQTTIIAYHVSWSQEPVYAEITISQDDVIIDCCGHYEFSYSLNVENATN